MSSRSDELLIADIQDAIESIFRYTKNTSEEAFLNNPEKCDAVIRNIEIIGEAVSKLPAHFRLSHASIPWAEIIAMRNRLIHGYFGVSNQIVWQVVIADLPPLARLLKSM